MIDPVELCRIEEARQADVLREMIGVQREFKPDREADLLEVAGGVAGWGGPGVWWSQACGIAIGDAITTRELNELTSFYVDHGGEPKVITTTYSDASMIAGLARRGYVLRWMESVFARDLTGTADPVAELPQGWPDGLRVERIGAGDEAGRIAAARLMTLGFTGKADGELDPTSDLTLRNIVRLPDLHVLLAYLGDDPTPVGYGSVVVTDGQPAGSPHRVARIFGGTTRPDVRRRGIQSALIAHRMQIAREHGCTIATIDGTSGEGTERNARRLGFQLSYWRNEMVLMQKGLAPAGYL